MARYFFLVCVLVWTVLPVSLVSCASGGKATAGLSAEEERRFNYYFAEAVKSKLAGRYDDAFELYYHCLDINPDAAEALYSLGLFYPDPKDSAICADFLTRAVEGDADNIYYKEALATFFLRHRDKERAATVLEDMVRCNPNRSDVLAQLENIYMDEGKYSEAVGTLDRIETIEGKSLAVSMEKFKLYREMKEYDKAFAELESLSDDNPNDLAYRVLIGDQYLQMGETEKAEAIYNEVAEREPGNQTLRLSMLDFYKQTGQDSLYQVQFDNLLFGESTDERARVVLMRDFILDRERVRADSTEVLNAFSRVFTVTPESLDMLALYASYLQIKNMNDSLETALARILVLEPDNQAALNQSVQLALKAENYQKVTELCAQGITHYPDQLLYYFYQGVSYYRLDVCDKALDSFRMGVRQIKPNTELDIAADMFSIMGDLYYANGFRDSAYIAYDSCLVYNPNNVGCLNNYAYYLSLEKRDLDKAEEMSRKALRSEPNNKIYLPTYAWILFVKGEYEEAKIYMDRVLEGDVENDEDVSGGVLEHAGDIYAVCGDMEGAVKYWRMALKKGDDVSDLLKRKIQQKKYIAE